MAALFEYYPGLGGGLPWVSLANLPTPITRRGWPGQPGKRIWIKRDDLSSPLYGGNKIRKLEFLLGRALAENRKAVMTFGVAGSNHVLATARCSKKLGLECIAILSRQPTTSYLAANLAAVARSGARTCDYPRIGELAMAAVTELRREKKETGVYPLVIPAGGSNATGATGFVSAAFELRRQIEQGLLAEPDFIYMAMGTTGSVAGLGLGLAAAGLDSLVIAVRVVDESVANPCVLESLWRRTVMRLRKYDENFPDLPFDPERFDIRQQYLGAGYARGTPAGLKAVAIGRKLGLKLEGTYTGKALAALNDDLLDQASAAKVLFWNTANSRALPPASGLDPTLLDAGLQKYIRSNEKPG
ncbi:MAG: pyridoxal-phosphate dependent enzyme [Gammaproteobacteria bacterium]|nr:pyridoxal-phosphate dependent enzyme [Gammaproteobacteria bacterium]